MKSTLIKFPAVSFRKIASPYEDRGGRTYIAVVNVKDVPGDFEDWRGLNPRDPKVSSGVSRQIFDTLTNTPDSFFFKNRGITVIADKVKFDNEKNIVELEMLDKATNGLLDGGHTFRVIQSYVEKLSKEELSDFDAFVKLEILEGIQDRDMVVGIVEARNTSTQVKEQSLEELRRRYSEVQRILSGKEYANRIAYKEYELLEDGSQKDIDIKELLSYLVCFDVEKFDGNTHPIKAYSTKASVVEHFKDQPRVLKYVPLLPQILELRDVIYQSLPEAYNSQGGKFGKLMGIVEVSNRTRMDRVELPFIKSESSYRIPSGFIYPILAAFRNIVLVKGDRCEWKTDPIKFFHELKVELASRIGEQALEFRNPNKLGKDNATWGRCYDLVQLETLKRNF